MSYRARYRFKLLSPIQGAKRSILELIVPGLPSVPFEMGEEAFPVGHWATAKVDGFATVEEAREAGQRLGDTLLIVGAVAQLGIDIGFSRSTLQFGVAVHEAVREQTGRELRAETHGLMIYEKGTVKIIEMQARGSVLISAESFEENLAYWIKMPRTVTERQRNCASLINDSFFMNNIEGQFILRISAAEALCEQSPLGANYQTVIEDLERHLEKQAVDLEVRETLRRTLANSRRQSIRQSYMTKIRSLCSNAEATEFDKLYEKRSRLVHEGIGRGELGEAANAALRLAVSLLKSELQLA